jgi:hypothetical protein
MNRRKTTLLVAICTVSVSLAANSPRQSPADGTPPAPENVPASVQFALGGNAAEIPAVFVDNLIFLPLSVNQGQSSLFILDSIAALTSIDPGRAAELGIGSNREASLEFPGVALSLPTLPLAAEQNFAAQTGRTYEGTLGDNLFSSLVVEIDYARKTVRFYDPSTYKYSGTGKSFALSFDARIPAIRAKFTVSGEKSYEGDFAINTALDESIVIAGKYAQAHRISASHVKTISAGDIEMAGSHDAPAARIKDFKIGPWEVDEPITVFPPGALAAVSDARFAGEIGGGILRRFTVVFDYPHRQIILAPNSDIQSDDLGDMSGISIVASGSNLKTFEVKEVRSGTPGSDAKIQKGDIIAGVDGEPAADLSLAEILELFRQNGHKYKLLILRNGETHTITIQMRRLI